jgi:hypothetical protein
MTPDQANEAMCVFCHDTGFCLKEQATRHYPNGHIQAYYCTCPIGEKIRAGHAEYIKDKRGD